jgi:hypothetical protein
VPKLMRHQAQAKLSYVFAIREHAVRQVNATLLRITYFGGNPVPPSPVAPGAHLQPWEPGGTLSLTSQPKEPDGLSLPASLCVVVDAHPLVWCWARRWASTHMPKAGRWLMRPRQGDGSCLMRPLNFPCLARWTSAYISFLLMQDFFIA